MTNPIEQLYQSVSDYVNCGCAKRDVPQETQDTIDRLLATRRNAVTGDVEFTNRQVQNLVGEQDALSRAVNDREFEHFISHKLQSLSREDIERYTRLTFASDTYAQIRMTVRGRSMLAYMMMAIAATSADNRDTVDGQFIGWTFHLENPVFSVDNMVENNLDAFIVIEYLCAKKLKVLSRLSRIPLQKVLLSTYEAKSTPTAVSWADLVRTDVTECTQKKGESREAGVEEPWVARVRFVDKKESQAERKRMSNGRK